MIYSLSFSFSWSVTVPEDHLSPTPVPDEPKEGAVERKALNLIKKMKT
jgi:hypothetical protein